jgi:hypothetical protein
MKQAIFYHRSREQDRRLSDAEHIVKVYRVKINLLFQAEAASFELI